MLTYPGYVRGSIAWQVLQYRQELIMNGNCNESLQCCSQVLIKALLVTSQLCLLIQILSSLVAKMHICYRVTDVILMLSEKRKGIKLMSCFKGKLRQ